MALFGQIQLMELYVAVPGASIEVSKERHACAAPSPFPAAAAESCKILFPQMGISLLSSIKFATVFFINHIY